MNSSRNPLILVRVGRVLGTFGVRGHIKCAYTTDNPELIPDCPRLLLVEPRSHECLPVEIAEVQLRSENFLVRFAGHTAPEPLKRFGGWDLVRPTHRGELPREDDEIYFFELEGMEVRTTAGDVIGNVHAICETPAHVLLELSSPGHPLIPFTRRHIPEVNLEEGWLTTDYPLGDHEVAG